MNKIIQDILLFIKNMPWGWFDAFKHYFYYKGRTNRAGFWSFAVMNSLIALLLFFVSYFLGLVYRIQLYSFYIDAYLFFTIYILLSLIPSFFLCIRRLHDLNIRGFWFWIWLFTLFISIPYIYINFICQWFLLFVACYPSSDNNKFGDKPDRVFSV